MILRNINDIESKEKQTRFFGAGKNNGDLCHDTGFNLNAPNRRGSHWNLVDSPM